MEGLPEEIITELNRLGAKMGKFYNRQGEVISWTDMIQLQSENPEYFRVAKDCVQQGRVNVEISTVWLGSQHCGGLLSPENSNKPLIFETMVFCTNENFTQRYATEEEALAGHALIVKCVREGKPIPLEDHDISAKLKVLSQLLGE